MFFEILMLLFNLSLGENVPKNSLYPKPKRNSFKLNEAFIIIMFFIFACIFFISIFFLIGSCTDSGVFYNSHLY